MPPASDVVKQTTNTEMKWNYENLYSYYEFEADLKQLLSRFESDTDLCNEIFFFTIHSY